MNDSKNPQHSMAESPQQIDMKAVRSRIYTLALPALVEWTLMTLVSMADMIMVSRLGAWATASIGLSNQPLFVAFSVFLALNVGATALVARSVGAGNKEDAAAAARQALVLASCLGLALSLAGFIWAKQLLVLMGAEADVMGPGTAYMRVVALGLMFQGPSISLSASLRGAGDTRTPMTVNMVANVVNVVGNYILIHGHFGFPRLEVVGAGVATTLSRMTACAYVIYKVYNTHHEAAIKLSFSDSYKPDKDIVRRILNVGLPAAGEQLVMRTGQMTFARIISSFGTVTYAAHQVAMNIEGLSFTPGQAFQIASTTLVGQSLGANEPEKAIRTGWEARKIGVWVSVLMGLVFFFFGRHLVLMYSNDPTVIDLSAGALKIIAVAQPFMISNFILAGGLRGAGDSRWALYITFAGIWGVRVITAYILAIKMNMGLNGAWIGMALDMAVRAVLMDRRFASARWTEIQV